MQEDTIPQTGNDPDPVPEGAMDGLEEPDMQQHEAAEEEQARVPTPGAEQEQVVMAEQKQSADEVTAAVDMEKPAEQPAEVAPEEEVAEQ